MKEIQEWLGHSDFSTTANTYAHLDTAAKNTSAAKMVSVVSISPGIEASL
jgi:integrase